MVYSIFTSMIHVARSAPLLSLSVIHPDTENKEAASEM